MTKMDRAAKSALFFFPPKKVASWSRWCGWRDLNAQKRKLHRQAFRCGESITTQRAIDWLKENADKYMWFDETTGECGLTNEFEQAFRNGIK